MPKVSNFNGYRVVDRRVASRVAHIFLRHPLVKRVELFGSVAREGTGSDLDLTLIMETELYLEYFSLCLNELSQCFEDIYSAARVRLKVAAEIFGDSFALVLATAERLAPPQCLDIFVFPPDWRNQLDFLQNSFVHKDPNFMYNIAKDSIVLAP